jgi:hypothetical protein
MPVTFRKVNLPKPKFRHVRQDAYLNGQKLWKQPEATTTKIKEPQKRTENEVTE